jgi:hypothetical protein
MIAISSFLTHIADGASVSGNACLGGGDCSTGLPTAGATSANLAHLLAIVFAVLGVLAVIIIVTAGISYVESGGDPQGVSRAKATIIYALVGLVLAISAEAIVAFVLGGL